MVFAQVVYQEKLCDNLSVGTKNRVSDVNCLNSDCKGWDITGFKQYIVLKAPFSVHILKANFWILSREWMRPTW